MDLGSSYVAWFPITIVKSLHEIRMCVAVSKSFVGFNLFSDLTVCFPKWKDARVITN